MKQTVFATALASLLPMTALAESGTVSLGYGQTDNGSDTFDSWLVNGTYSTDFANGLMIDLTGRANLLDDGGDEAEIYNVFGSVGYQFQNGLTAGAYLQRFSFDDSVRALDSYGLSLGYAAAGVDVSAYFGETNVDGSDNTYDEWGLQAGYRTGSLGVYGSYQNLEVSGGDELTATGLAGHYKVTPEIALFGGAMSLDGFFGDTVEGGGIGASYKIPGAFSRRALVLSGEYHSFSDSGGGDSIEGFSLMLTMPFGEADAAVPDQSVAGMVANPGYSTFGTIYDSLF
jgi:hypothetical protein